MPLLDHFHDPLRTARHWESFHSRWAGAIADALNRDLLPSGYVAEIQIHIGGQVEIDVATLDQQLPPSPPRADPLDESIGTVTLPASTWTVPPPPMVMPTVFPDSLEVLILSLDAGPTLVAAVELISPRNKDRPQSRRAFVTKCASYLHEGIGLVVVDIVTNRRSNLHNELVDLLQAGQQFRIADEPLYAVAYRPIRRSDEEQIDIWPSALALGHTLPTLPLGLRNSITIPVELEATYQETCLVSRLGNPDS